MMKPKHVTRNQPKELNIDAQKVKSYYSRLGSQIGYRFVMKKSQHFGLYDASHTTEIAAQANYHEKFADILDLLPGMRLLDAGCGQGTVGVYLAKNHDVQVAGVTVVDVEVNKAKKLAAKAGVSELTEFQIADYHQLPFEDNSFDRVYTTETLSHAYDLSLAVSELFRVLKPGGLLVSAEYEFDFDRSDVAVEAKHAAEFVKKYAAIHGVFEFDKGNFKKILDKSGFVQVIEHDWTDALVKSFNRLEKLSAPIKKVVKALKREHKHPNTIAASLYAEAYREGAFWYKIYVAKKLKGDNDEV